MAFSLVLGNLYKVKSEGPQQDTVLLSFCLFSFLYLFIYLYLLLLLLLKVYMIYYIIIYILRRGRRGRQQDKKTTRQQDSLVGDLQISLHTHLQEPVKKSHFL